MLCDDANVRVLFAISLHCVDCRVVCNSMPQYAQYAHKYAHIFKGMQYTKVCISMSKYTKVCKVCSVASMENMLRHSDQCIYFHYGC